MNIPHIKLYLNFHNYFCRIDDIISHYQHEQIVQGQTLTAAVPKTIDITRQNHVDIYETLSRVHSTGSRAIINDSGVSKRGHLFKKGACLH